MYYEVGAKQVQGGRDYQEDCFQVFFPETEDVDKRQVLIVLADGMGGHAGGAVASEIVVEKVVREMSKGYPAENFPDALLNATNAANKVVQEQARERPELQGMGCTLVAFNLDEKTLHWISVGDSLLYLLRGGEVIRKNDDHSYGGYMDRLIAAGEEIPETPGFTPRRNMLMSYINGEEIAMIDCPEEGHDVRPGDRLIVASDGLDTISSDDFPALSKNAHTAQAFADALIDAVEQVGKRNQDNTTVVVVDVIGSPGDDTTQDTPGDWVGDTFLPNLDDGEPDVTLQDLESDETPVEDPVPAEQPVGPPVSGGEVAAEAYEPVQRSRSTSNVVPDQEVPAGLRRKNTIIAVLIVVALLVLIGGSYVFFSDDSSTPVDQGLVALGRDSGQFENSTASAGADPVLTPSPAQPGDLSPEVPAKPFQDPLKNGGMGPMLVKIPSGRFTQGSSSLSPVFNERPSREVLVPAFAITVTEITFAEYAAFVSAVGGQLPADQGWGRNNRPVINVSWDDARAYAAWLSSQTGKRYRLPSESEWEYAARAGTSGPYWWGRKPGQNRANCWGCGSEWDGVKTAPVGSFPGNPWGVRDSAGNVHEWVADCMHKNYEGAPVDGSSWQVSGCSERVVRGGSWSNPADGSRVARRIGMRADVRQDNLGFRLVRELD